MPPSGPTPDTAPTLAVCRPRASTITPHATRDCSRLPPSGLFPSSPCRRRSGKTLRRELPAKGPCMLRSIAVLSSSRLPGSAISWTFRGLWASRVEVHGLCHTIVHTFSHAFWPSWTWTASPQAEIKSSWKSTARSTSNHELICPSLHSSYKVHEVHDKSTTSPRQVHPTFHTWNPIIDGRQGKVFPKIECFLL